LLLEIDQTQHLLKLEHKVWNLHHHLINQPLVLEFCYCLKTKIISKIKWYMQPGKQEFRRTDFGSRLLATEDEGRGGSEGEGGENRCGWGWGVCLKWSNILLVVARSPRLKWLRRNSCYPAACSNMKGSTEYLSESKLILLIRINSRITMNKRYTA
jgi:hypothetical protein